MAARVGFYLSPFGVPEADEAVGGLMARHALHGEWLSVFYWGQAYGGPLETWLAAPLLALTGPSWLALRLVPMVLTVAATAVVWRVALRIANPLAAAAAAGDHALLSIGADLEDDPLSHFLCVGAASRLPSSCSRFSGNGSA